jgi:hypothetical protein
MAWPLVNAHVRRSQSGDKIAQMINKTGPGRNDPCPCGSGKKFKKCHGGTGQAAPRESRVVPAARIRADEGTTLEPNQTSASVPLGGFPGQNQHYTIVNQFRNGRPSHPAGHPGQYKVVFVFSRPGRAPRSDRDLSFNLASEGDSHLSINAPQVLPRGTEGENVIALHLEHTHRGRTVKLVCGPNAQGFVASAEAELSASSFQEAEVEASRALTPALSMWSATLNIPLHIHQVEVTELRTGNVRLSVTTPYYDAPAGMVSQSGLNEDFLWFAALYREATNTNSPLYRFLCIYKIIEGIVVRRAATKVYPRVKERVPDDPAHFNQWLDALFPVRPAQWDAMALDSVFTAEALGRTVGDIRDKYLRPIRNDIGHLFGESEGTNPKARLWIDDPQQTIKVHHWLPLATCIARLMLKNEFPGVFLAFLDERGNSPGGPPNPALEPTALAP